MRKSSSSSSSNGGGKSSNSSTSSSSNSSRISSMINEKSEIPVVAQILAVLKMLNSLETRLGGNVSPNLKPSLITNEIP